MGHKLEPQPLTGGKRGRERRSLIDVALREREGRRRGRGNVHQGNRGRGKDVWWILMCPAERNSARGGQQASKDKRVCGSIRDRAEIQTLLGFLRV